MAFALAGISQIDYLLADFNGELSSFKIFHILTIRDSDFHKLNDKNYKRLTIWSRIVITFVLYYGVLIVSILLNSLVVLIAYISYENCQQIYWLIHLIVMTAPYVTMFTTVLSTSSVFLHQ